MSNSQQEQVSAFINTILSAYYSGGMPEVIQEHVFDKENLVALTTPSGIVIEVGLVGFNHDNTALILTTSLDPSFFPSPNSPIVVSYTDENDNPIHLPVVYSGIHNRPKHANDLEFYFMILPVKEVTNGKEGADR